MHGLAWVEMCSVKCYCLSMSTDIQAQKFKSTASTLAALQAEQERERQQTAEVAPLDAATLARLEEMDAGELRGLVRRMACQCGLAALMSEEETAQAMLDVLAQTALKPIVQGLNMRADIQSRLTAVEKWLDRKHGKPVQRQLVAAQVDDMRGKFMASVEKLDATGLRELIEFIEG